MDISHIEHIGIAVPSLDEAIPFYEKMLGFKCFEIGRASCRERV